MPTTLFPSAVPGFTLPKSFLSAWVQMLQRVAVDLSLALGDRTLLSASLSQHPNEMNLNKLIESLPDHVAAVVTDSWLALGSAVTGSAVSRAMLLAIRKKYRIIHTVRDGERFEGGVKERLSTRIESGPPTWTYHITVRNLGDAENCFDYRVRFQLDESRRWCGPLKWLRVCVPAGGTVEISGEMPWERVNVIDLQTRVPFGPSAGLTR